MLPYLLDSTGDSTHLFISKQQVAPNLHVSGSLYRQIQGISDCGKRTVDLMANFCNQTVLRL
jgi:hypothetical protein